MKSALTMSCSGSVVECRVEKRSSASSRIATYTCDSCGRVATSVRTDKLSHCCRKTTQRLVEAATEISVPKCEFGTDFIAVVCRGKVVDILLASGRSSVRGCLSDAAVQQYVDRFKCSEAIKATDIEVKYGNNVYVVRQEAGAPRIFIPAISTEEELGDSYLSASEQEAILALATNSTPLARDTTAIQAADGICSPPHTSMQTEKLRFIPELPKRNINFSQHPYHRIALAFGYAYQSQVSSKIDHFLYTHVVGHNLEFAKLPADSGECKWTHIKWQPFLRKEGRDNDSLITYLLARHDFKGIADSTPAMNLLASPNEVLK
jgi:hypothetical protein